MSLEGSGSSAGGIAEVEATGETVGEAKWVGLRELERSYPGLDREQVTFEVLSEGERGLLGVGMAPARVVARFDPSSAVRAVEPTQNKSSNAAALVREILQEIADAVGARCRVDIEERENSLAATVSGSDVALLIGKRGKTIDSIQYLVSAALVAAEGEHAPKVVVDAAEYRARRESRLAELAARSAERAIRTGDSVALEPMTSPERKIVHLHLRDMAGIETHSEGVEPYRHIVVTPATSAVD